MTHAERFNELRSISFGGAPCRFLSGRFNDVVIVNDAVVLRFPKYRWVMEQLEYVSSILQSLQTRVTLPLPAPHVGAFSQNRLYMSYALIPGSPLWPDVICGLSLGTI